MLHNHGSSDPAFQSTFFTRVCNNSILLSILCSILLSTLCQSLPFAPCLPEQQCQVCHFSACSINREAKASRENSNHCPCLSLLELKPQKKGILSHTTGLLCCSYLPYVTVSSASLQNPLSISLTFPHCASSAALVRAGKAAGLLSEESFP